MPITTERELQHFLTSKDIPCHTATLLTGGTANYVWRISTLLGRTSIIKHAEDHVRSNPSRAFPSNRITFEYLALSTVPTWLPESQDESSVRLPTPYHFFEAEHVLELQDVGSRTLKDAYIHDASLDVPAIGTSVGSWLARLHNVTAAAGVLAVVREKFNNGAAKQIYRVAYEGLAGAMEEYGFERGLGERVNERFGALLATDEVGLCHGDFWPGNLIVEEDERGEEGTNGVVEELVEKRPGLTVVDWEMVRSGNGATDVGQFAAEAWLLDRFHGARGLLDAFLTAYVKNRALGFEDKIRVAVHFGTHIGYWPTRVNWADQEQTREVLAIAGEVLETAEKGDLEKLERSPLGQLFGER